MGKGIGTKETTGLKEREGREVEWELKKQRDIRKVRGRGKGEGNAPSRLDLRVTYTLSSL